MDYTTLAAARTGLSALFGISRSAMDAVVDHRLKETLIRIQEGILEVQSKLADATEERLNLLEEVAELKQKLRDLEASRAALDSYELHAVAPGQHLYKSKSAEHAVDHYACPQCHNAGKVTVMQSKLTGKRQTQYRCSTCKFSLFVGPDDDPDPIHYRRGAY